MHHIIRRVTQRQHLLRPDRPIVQNCGYLLAYAAEKHGVEIHNATFMSTHPHLDVTDVHGDTLPGFMRDLFSLLARSTNCYLGRWENFWASGRPHTMEVPRT
jgi:REP element-mobilizing transposase RayT